MLEPGGLDALDQRCAAEPGQSSQPVGLAFRARAVSPLRYRGTDRSAPHDL